MTRNRRVTLLALSLTLLLTPGTRADEKAKSTAVDPSGTWRWEHDEQGQTVKDMLRFNYDPQSGKLTGYYHGRIGPIELEEAKIDGDKLSCEFDVEHDGASFEVEFEGTIDGDRVVGAVQLSDGQDSQEFPWLATRSVKNDDVLGTWNIRIELDNGNILMPSLKIAQDDKGGLVGEYTSTNGNVDINLDELAVRDNRLLFTISAALNGNMLTAKYDVAPRGDKFDGSVAYDFNGQTGEINVAATRKTDAKADKAQNDDDDKDDDDKDDDDDGDQDDDA